MVQKIVHQVLPPAETARRRQCSQCNDLLADLRKVAAMISGTHMRYYSHSFLSWPLELIMASMLSFLPKFK